MRTAKVAPAANQAMTLSLTVATDSVTATEAAGTVSLQSDILDEQPIDEGTEADAKRVQARATDALKSLRVQFDAYKPKLAGASVTQVSGEIAAIEAQMKLGSTTLGSGHFDEAMGDYSEALNRATRLGVLLAVQARVQQNIISPILEKALEVDIPPTNL